MSNTTPPVRFRPWIFALAAAVWIPAWAVAEDWPEFRGPHRDGISHETGLATSWPETGPEELWRIPVGGGYSGVAVVARDEGHRLYTQWAEGSDELVVALDSATGKELWRVRSGGNRRDSQGDGPRATPSVAGNSVFVVTATGLVLALDRGDGSVRWSKELAQTPHWGVSASPLVEGGLLFVSAGQGNGRAVVALDRQSGEERWAGGDDAASYASPMIVEMSGVRQLLNFGANGLISLDPQRGDVLWQVAWATMYDVNAAQPVPIPPDAVLISSGYDHGVAVLQLRAEGDGLVLDRLWHGRSLKNQFASSVYMNGAIFGFDNSTFKCLNARTGELHWQGAKASTGSVLGIDGHILILDGGGKLILARAETDGFHEQARAKVLSGKSWVSPAYSDGVLYARSSQEMVALRLAGE